MLFILTNLLILVILKTKISKQLITVPAIGDESESVSPTSQFYLGLPSGRFPRSHPTVESYIFRLLLPELLFKPILTSECRQALLM